MAQHDFDIANQSGASFRSDLNNALLALVSINSGASEPATKFAYQCWADTSNGVMKQRNAANNAWIVRGSLAETRVVTRASNTILGIADFAKLFVATAAFTQTLTAAATLGDGWWCAYNANGNSIILDPNASETIDGATTKTVTGSGFIICTGSAFYTLSFAGAVSGSLISSGYTMNTSRMIGRTTASAGAPEEISVGTGLSLSAGVLACTVSGAAPQGGTGAIQYNNAGSFGGVVISGLVKGNGSSAPSAAVAGTDYLNVFYSSAGSGTDLVHYNTGGGVQLRTVRGTALGNTTVTVAHDGNGNVEITANHPPGGTSLHPDSLIEMANGTLRALRDVRVGDMVRGENGPAEVLGIWHSGLTGRPLWAVDSVAATGGHLFKTRTGWAAPDPDAYRRESHNLPSVVKGKHGLIELNRGGADDPDAVEKLEVGMEILRSDGSYAPVTRLKAYESRGGAAARAPAPHEQPVYSLLLYNSKLLFADGIAVAAMA